MDKIVVSLVSFSGTFTQEGILLTVPDPEGGGGGAEGVSSITFDRF